MPGLELRDRRRGGVRRVDLREGELRLAERVLVIHDLALRDVHQAPADRRERRRIGMRRFGIIDRPAPVIPATHGPASRDRLPEECIVGETVDTPAEVFVCLLQLPAEEFDGCSRHRTER